MNCILILDKYVSDWNDDHLDDIAKWSKRLKSSIEEDISENKHRRACLSNVNSLIQLLEIYSELSPALEMDDIMKFITEKNKDKAIVDLTEFRREIHSILGFINKHNLKMEHQHLHTINDIIDELYTRRSGIQTIVEHLNSSLTDLHSHIDALKDEFPDKVKKCLFKHEDAEELINAWQEMQKILQPNIRSHAKCKMKIAQYLELLDQMKSEKQLEKNLMEQLESLRNTKYKNALEELNTRVCGIGIDRKTVAKIHKIICDTKRPIVSREDVVDVIKRVFKDCFINTNKFMYSQEF